MEENALKAIKQAEEHFIEKIAENMNTYGISSTVGRVLGIIYMNRKPMTLNELSEETGMSKTRMSQVVREMLDLNIAEKVFEKGVRKDLYDVEQDYYQTFISLFTAN
ncbi:GbsR/MarR family transcriptional regulator, partial [Bacillus paralicheniformis]